MPPGCVTHRRCGKPPASLSVGLIAFWEMEEASGTRVDAAGHVNLTEHGSVAQAAGRVGNCSSWSSNAANYLNADGSLTPLNETVNKQFELSIWVQLSSLANRTIFDLSTVITNRAITVEYSTTAGAFRVFGRSTQIDATTFGVASINTWYLIHIYDDGVNFGFLINNGSGQTAARSALAASTCANLRIGVDNASNGGANPWGGLSDQVGLWTGRSLTANERTYIYNAGAGRTYAQIASASP